MKRKYRLEDYDISASEFSALVDEWVFNERDRAIFKRSVLDGIPFEPLAEEFDLSVPQVKNIVYKCGKQVFKRIN